MHRRRPLDAWASGLPSGRRAVTIGGAMPDDRLERADRHDAIVVGAGIGGLVAAALLARRGLDVLVVDRHAVAGGNATIFSRRGYAFDVGLHYVGGCHAGGALPAVLEAAGAGDVRFLELDPSGYDELLLPGLRLLVPRGLEAWRDRLCERFPRERRGIDRYGRLLAELKRGLDVWHRPGALLASSLRSPHLLRWSLSSFGAFLGSCTRDPLLSGALAAQHVGYALPPSRASTLVGAGIALHYLEGAWYPAGGGQVLADALADSIRRHGGRLALRTAARRILLERGTVAGVELEDRDGRRVVRAPVVISNADLKHTLLGLVGEGGLRPATARRARAWDMAPALGVAYVGLRGDLRTAGHPARNAWVLPRLDLESEYAQAAAGRLPDEPGLFVTVASLKDPAHAGLAPAGVTNVQLMGVAPSAPAAWGVTEAEADDGRYRRQPAYLERKREYGERLLASAARLWPDVAARVEYLELSTPLTHRRYTGSTGGTGYGLAATPAQMLWRRPGARTEIRGLYLCGASCRSGHGIVGAALSGVFAAGAVLPGRLAVEVLGRRLAARGAVG